MEGKGNPACYYQRLCFNQGTQVGPIPVLAQFVYFSALLQGLTLISGTRTGCRRLDSYIEQKKCLACGPEFSVEFSALPEFSGGVTEKFVSTGWARTFDLQITKQILYHCATAPLCLQRYNIYVLFARIFRSFL